MPYGNGMSRRQSENRASGNDTKAKGNEGKEERTVRVNDDPPRRGQCLTPRGTGVTARYPHVTGGPGAGIAGSLEDNQGVGHYETGHARLHLRDTKRWWLYLRADVTRDPKGTPGYASGHMQQKASPVLPPEDQKAGIPEAGRTPLTLNEDREEGRIGTADRPPRGGVKPFPHKLGARALRNRPRWSWMDPFGGR
jgi:hypothetical protein